MSKTIGILTAGSDCPGLNAVIRAAGKAAIKNNFEILGFQDGFEGFLKNDVIPLGKASFSDILTVGGTILGTSRCKPQQVALQDQVQDMTSTIVANYRKHNLTALLCAGGYETIETALTLSNQGLNIICIPAAVDNDVAKTDVTIGFDTALQVATEAIDRLHSTAQSHHRIIIVEMLGQVAGWLALGSGISGGADVILIPEIPYDINKVAEAIIHRSEAGKRFSIVAVSEGAISKDYADFFKQSRVVNEQMRNGLEKEVVDAQLEEIEKRLPGTTLLLSHRLEDLTGLETRITILGHLLRGGTPSYGDRLLATRMGATAIAAIQKKQFRTLISLRNGEIITAPLEESAGLHKPIPLNHCWIESAHQVETCMGD